MKLILLSVLLCFSMFADAQIQWAVKAGGQISTARYKRQETKISTKSIAGFNAGVMAKVYFDDKVSFVSGLLYNSRGFKVTTLPGDTLKTYRLNYIDIPIMIQIDLSKNRGVGWYCRFGPSIGVGLYGREIYTGKDGETINNKAILSVTGNHFGLYDASVNAVLGFATAKKFFIEAGYMYGVGNINNDPDGPDIKTRVASLSIGYYLR